MIGLFAEHPGGEQLRRNTSLVEVVWVYRDQAQASYEEALRFLQEKPEVHSVFNLVARVHDASGQGLGLCFEGQEQSAAALVQPGEPYLLKIGLVQRTRRGRVVSPQAAKHIGINAPKGDQRNLF